MRVLLNTKHLVERIQERGIRLSPSTDLKKLVQEWVTTLRRNAPEDWRFTMNPTADFFLTFIDGETQIKILGRSYRLTAQSDVLWQKIERAAKDRRVNRDETVRFCADLYRKELADDSAEICHQLSTAYAPEWALNYDRRWHPDDTRRHPHTMLLQASETSTNLAKRPNALLLAGLAGTTELWVRQGNPYVAMNSTGRSVDSYCLFCRLNTSGIVPEDGALWRFDEGGQAHFVGKASCGSAPTFPGEKPPNGFRSWNYWSLPLLLDVRFRDLVERQQKATNTFPVEAVMIELIRRIYEIAQEDLPGRQARN